MSSTLYELTEEFEQLANMDAGDDEAFAQALADTLEATGEQLEQKIEGTIIVAKGYEGEAALIDQEIERLKKRKDTAQRRAEECKRRVIEALERTDRKKVVTHRFNITRVPGRPVAEILDASKIPPTYIKERVTTSPSKTDILAALKEGKKIPGAKLGESKPSLRVS